jgi:hypothetical protein
MDTSATNHTLSVDDVRHSARLVHELCELGSDPVEWNTRLLEALTARLECVKFAIGGIIRARNFDPTLIEMPLYATVNADGVWDRYFDARDVSDQPNPVDGGAAGQRLHRHAARDGG